MTTDARVYICDRCGGPATHICEGAMRLAPQFFCARCAFEHRQVCRTCIDKRARALRAGARPAHLEEAHKS